MISKDMYRLLKRFPRWPDNKPFDIIEKIPFMDKYLCLGLLMDAKQKGLVGCNGKEEENTAGYFLAEDGRAAIEEYKRQKGADNKATWALVIAGLSFLSSVAAVVVACFVQ